MANFARSAAAACFMLTGLSAHAATSPVVAPGTYSGTYTCRDRVAKPVNIYVLDQFEPYSKTDMTPYQKVRIEFEGGLMVGKIFLNGMNQVRIGTTVIERNPRPGVSPYVTFDLDSYENGLRGATKYERDVCQLVANRNPNGTPVSGMSYATREAPAYATAPIPEGYAAVQTIPQGDRYIALARATIQDDAENWGLNSIKPGSLSDFQFYSAGELASPILRFGYYYSDFYAENNRGWVEVRFAGGAVECVRFHDRKTCVAPRPSRTRQMADLGKGKPSLGPLILPAACFRREQRKPAATPVYYTVRTGPDPDDFEQRISHWVQGAPYSVDVYQCARREVKVECVSQGMGKIAEALVGVGATKNQDFTLIPGNISPTKAEIAEINARIATKSCVRTQ